jgi:hypothetical protein
MIYNIDILHRRADFIFIANVPFHKLDLISTDFRWMSVENPNILTPVKQLLYNMTADKSRAASNQIHGSTFSGGCLIVTDFWQR